MKKIVLLSLIIAIAGCKPKKSELPPLDIEKYKTEIDQWHEKRVENLKGPNGWLNVVGLFWLNDGINTFGSDIKNDVVFPEGKIPARAGSFLLSQGRVTLNVTPSVEITVNKSPVSSLVVFHPDSARPAVQEYKTLQWFVIKRDNKYGIRLRDFESPALQSFSGIERFPTDPAWRIEAFFEPAKDSTRKISITNILGQTTPQPSPGTLHFSLNEHEYSLDVLDEGGTDYFVIVGDSTNTHETYGAGRYMYVNRPAKDGKVVVDFNKLYNPPCAFTSFATCPLPPKQNVLSVPIRAGEKNYSVAH